MRNMVLVYLPTKLADFVGAHVGIHIPGPDGAYVIEMAKQSQVLSALSEGGVSIHYGFVFGIMSISFLWQVQH